MIECTVVFVLREDTVLLGVKKKKVMAGLLGQPGGKVEKGETPEENARRELFEEAGLVAGQLEYAGTVDILGNGGRWEEVRIHVFRCRDYSGEPRDSDEMGDYAFYPSDALPKDRMRASDLEWIPAVLRGETINMRIDRRT